MKDKNEEHRSERPASHIVFAYSGHELDFLGLWNVLVRRKTTAITVTFVAFVAIVAYIFLNAPVPLYQARVILSQPSERDIEGIQKFARENTFLVQSISESSDNNFLVQSISGSGDNNKENEEYTPDKIFAAFLKSMKNRALQLRYFYKNKLIDKLESDRGSEANQVFDNRFNNMLTVEAPDSLAYVNLKGLNSKLSAELVNGYVLFANKEMVRALLQTEINKRYKLKTLIESKVNDLSISITDRRNEAKRKREDRIIQLEEAAHIAERIGANDNTTKSVFFLQPPLYMLGTKALRSEVAVLRLRKNDDPFDSEIRRLQFQLAHLKSQLSQVQSDFAKLKFARSNIQHISVAQVVEKATATSKPINQPALKRVLVFGILGGLFLGLLAAYALDFVTRSREKNNVQSGNKVL